MATTTVAFVARLSLGSTGAADHVHKNRWSWRATIDEGTSFLVFYYREDQDVRPPSRIEYVGGHVAHITTGSSL